ncbi:MAG: histidine phosphatase family protein [Ignavibacteria bacterium]
MKTLYLIRHAKSSWKHPQLKDHDRPFNKRGEKDAPEMALNLRKKNIFPDIILSSTAVRALEYAKILAKELNYKKKDIETSGELYLADESDMLKAVRNICNNNETAFLVGHNPGITDLANSLCNYNTDNIPTSGVFGVRFDLDSWKDADYGKGEFLMFEYPKNLNL